MSVPTNVISIGRGMEKVKQIIYNFSIILHNYNMLRLALSISGIYCGNQFGLSLERVHMAAVLVFWVGLNNNHSDEMCTVPASCHGHGLSNGHTKKKIGALWRNLSEKGLRTWRRDISPPNYYMLDVGYSFFFKRLSRWQHFLTLT